MSRTPLYVETEPLDSTIVLGRHPSIRHRGPVLFGNPHPETADKPTTTVIRNNFSPPRAHPPRIIKAPPKGLPRDKSIGSIIKNHPHKDAFIKLIDHNGFSDSHSMDELRKNLKSLSSHIQPHCDC